jgi:hypothetical protein
MPLAVRRSLLPFLATPALLALVGCSEEPATLVVELTPGHETDALSRAPALARIDVTALDAAQAAIATATTTPGGSFSLGEVGVDQLVSIDAKGYAGDGSLVVAGQSLGVVVGALESDILPVFVQRLGEWSRPPDAFGRSHVGGIAAVVGERFVLSTGGRSIDGSDSGGDGTVEFYDLLGLGGSLGFTFTEAPPRSVVVSPGGEAALFISDERAFWIEFDSSASGTEVALPAGLDSFARVAGGQLVQGPEASYVVGPTQSDRASDRVLVVLPDRSVLSAALARPRQGAAAAWVEGVGLVIAGGSAEGAGVEVLAPGAAASAERPYPPDAVVGAAATAGSAVGSELVLLGGTSEGSAAATRALDLACAASCVPTSLPIDLGATLVLARAFVLPSGELLVVGSDSDSGLVRSFAVSLVTRMAREIPLKEPRRGATVVPLPTGALGLVGGEHEDASGAFSLEVFRP